MNRITGTDGLNRINKIKGINGAKGIRKRAVSLALSLMLVLVMAGCGSGQSSTSLSSYNLHIGCMKGPTAIGMIKLISDLNTDLNSDDSHTVTIAGTADELSTALIKGEMDIAAVPCNLASILYQKTEGEIVTVAINTLGVLYMVEAGDTVSSVEDLKGRTIYATGQGTTPEYTLRYLLSCAGLNPDTDVDIQFKSEATEVVAALSQDTSAIAMLPQPYVTVTLNSNESFRIALDVTKEWEQLAGSTVVTGVLVARRSFIEEQEDTFLSFMEKYRASTEFANSNVEETAALLEQFDVFKAAIAREAIPYCNVTCITGEEMKTAATAYLQVLYDQNPSAVGGALEEGMFYLETGF